MTDLSLLQPTRTVSVRDVFGIDTDMTVPAFAERTEHVPAIDKAYRLNPQVTQAILAGFAHNRRVVIQGLHGTGKSTHIEQVAARLNWPCVRVNLDGHISRLDLVGKDTIVLQEGKQVTQFQEGILPWSLQRPVASFPTVVRWTSPTCCMMLSTAPTGLPCAPRRTHSAALMPTRFSTSN